MPHGSSGDPDGTDGADAIVADATDAGEADSVVEMDATAVDADAVEPDTDVVRPTDAEDAEPPSDVDTTPDADVEPAPDTTPVEDIDTTPAVRCADLACAEDGRTCVESDGAADARCGTCLNGFLEEGEACVAPTCGGAEDCTPDPAASEWSTCGYTDACAREGTQTRLLYTGDCGGGRCEVTSEEQSRPCSELRATEGDPCLLGAAMGECALGECVLPMVALGAECATDSQCPNGSWCSTVSGFRRCSPRIFAGQERQMDFAYVPAGTFEQGTSGATDDERPYTATLTRSYFVSRTEVTQLQWLAATGGSTNPACFQSTTGTSCTTDNGNNTGPVEQIDWYAALAYANWLSSQNGLQPCYTLAGCSEPSTGWHDGGHDDCTGASYVGLDCTGYRLLTESEWERAARGGTTSTYFWGEAADAATVGEYAWFNANSGGRTQAVGQKLENAYGLYDMSGNVWEWVWDWVFTNTDPIPYPLGSATDHLGGESGAFRGYRGGSWNFGATILRSADRGSELPADRFVFVGMRLARTVP